MEEKGIVSWDIRKEKFDSSLMNYLYHTTSSIIRVNIRHQATQLQVLY